MSDRLWPSVPRLLSAATRDTWEGRSRVVADAHRTLTARRPFAKPDRRLLADTRMTRADALREAERTPWDKPTPPCGSPLEKRLAPLIASLREAWRLRRSRQQIAKLDPRLLKDIGVSYAEAELEANKPFWCL
jgi:uncharacterized protein YjiS (DUF1127 family)